MFTQGLVSVSFRPHSPLEILEAMKSAGLAVIEWGSDVHAPADDIEKLNEIVKLQEQYGIHCCSYGTYFKLGVDLVEDIVKYIRAAKILGTDVLRIWCGNKSSSKYTDEEKSALFQDAVRLAKIAEKETVTLCLECHRNSFTEEVLSSLELIQYVQSPNFKMYWQPNPDVSVAESLMAAEALAPYTVNIHCFNWRGKEKFPLGDAVDTWREYLKCFDGDHNVLLEFMPDNKLDSLKIEADALKEILK